MEMHEEDIKQSPDGVSRLMSDEAAYITGNIIDISGWRVTQ